MKRKKLSNKAKRKVSALMEQAKHAFTLQDFVHTETLCQHTLQLDADHPDAFNLLGMIAKQVNQTDAAIQLLTRASQLAPKRADIWNNLGAVYGHAGHMEQARNCFSQSLSLRPKQADVYSNQAVILEQLGQTPAAIASIQQAIQLKPKHPPYHEQLASLLEQQGDLEAAQRTLQHLIQLDPAYYSAYHSLAHIELVRGNFEQAESFARQCLNINPQYPESYALLAKIKHLNPSDIQHIQNILPQTPPQSESCAHLAFTLATALEQQQNYSQAFEYLQQANQIIRSNIQYDSSHDQQTFHDIKSIFTRDFLAQKSPFGIQDERPIFIVGMPRSGTSLVEQIIASHPQVHGTGESDLILYVFQHICQNEKQEQRIQHVLQLADSQWAHHAQYIIDSLLQAYPLEGITHYTDKTPNNYFFLGLIHILLPHARIIHCKRNAMDNCLSIYKEQFGGSFHTYAYDLDELGEFYLLYQDLMEHWHSVLPEGVMYEVEYEKLVANQKEETEKLLQHCRLDWHDDCLNFHKTKREVKTASAAQVRQPIYKTSVEAWRRYEAQLTPLAQKLGYK